MNCIIFAPTYTNRLYTKVDIQVKVGSFQIVPSNPKYSTFTWSILALILLSVCRSYLTIPLLPVMQRMTRVKLNINTLDVASFTGIKKYQLRTDCSNLVDGNSLDYLRDELYATLFNIVL